MLAKLTSKCQTTIPREVRARLGLRPGDHLLIWLEGDRMVARRAELGGATARPRRPSRNRDPELLEELFKALDALKRHQAEIVRAADDEVLLSFAVRHVDDAARAVRGISESLRRGGTPMLPWKSFTDLPPSGVSTEEARRWVEEELGLSHAMLAAYFAVVPTRGYLDGPESDDTPEEAEGPPEP